MKKTLLIVCGGIEATHGIKLAQDMGYHVVVSDMNPEAPGMKLGDDAIVASTYDVEETCIAAKHYNDNVRKLDGVICIGSDVPLTVAAVAEKLELPGISQASARLAADKFAMKEKFKADGVSIPWYATVDSVDELENYVNKKNFELVIKPVDSRGSRGVMRLDQVADLTAAFNHARTQSPTRRVMIEQYLSGPQISSESIILDGECFTPGYSDRNYEYLDRYAPFFIENGGDLPSSLGQDTWDLVNQLVADAAKSMDITRGNVKGDIVIHNGKPYIIELAARLSGGYFCTLEIPLSTGVDFVGNVIRMALNEPVDRKELQPKFLQPTVQRYKFPEPGRITAIWGEQEARHLPGVKEVMISANVGDVIPVPNDTTARAAMVIATADTLDEAKMRAAKAIDTIRIQTEPLEQSVAG